MEKKKQPATQAQAIFGKEFGNAPILNARPEGMPFDEYRKKRSHQTIVIRRVLR